MAQRRVASKPVVAARLPNLGAAEIASLQIGQTADIPIALLDECEFNARTHYTDEAVNEKAVLLAKNGQICGATSPRRGSS
jgi:hypothetical protein